MLLVTADTGFPLFTLPKKHGAENAPVNKDGKTIKEMIVSNDAASPRIKKVQATSLALLVISGGISYVDRATLSIANPLIRHDLGLSVAEMGLLLSAFLWSYAFFQMPIGALVDRLRARRLLTLGLVIDRKSVV